MNEKSDITFETRFGAEERAEASPFVHTEGNLAYRAVCKTAVISVVIAVVSVFSVLLAVDFLVLMMIPLLGCVLGVLAIFRIRKLPEELTGRTVAVLGVALCGTQFVVGVGWHWIYYLTEVPPDSIRVNWQELQPEDDPRQRVSRRALELDGQKIFIKGYIGPGTRKSNLKQFQLVWTLGQCCFGETPEPTHQIIVSLQEGLTVDYDLFPKRLTGILRVDAERDSSDPRFAGFYRLEADRIW